MNTEANNFHEEDELIEAVQRWEEMLRTGEIVYFYVIQFEYIIDNFLDEGRITTAFEVMKVALCSPIRSVFAPPIPSPQPYVPQRI